MVRKPNTDVSENGGIRSLRSACGGAQTPETPEDRVFHADAVPYRRPERIP
jgi:hypothetical protein